MLELVDGVGHDVARVDRVGLDPVRLVDAALDALPGADGLEPAAAAAAAFVHGKAVTSGDCSRGVDELDDAFGSYREVPRVRALVDRQAYRAAQPPREGGAAGDQTCAELVD
ncbi:hypothetical protein AB6N23_01815 [Cellulomonas sp. 179-A 9B4 NHS]|uniref:hypothetical protein n=1 Tax=Cellulomonas sp. 179-A 9B4 NHS TaxID=3142379 RepID=UPI0039A2AA7E